MAIPNTRIVQVVTNKNPFRFVSQDSDLGQVHRVHLKTLIVPNTEYNVNYKSNKVALTASDMIAVADIPVGNYDIPDFLDALKTVLDVAGSPNTFAITQNALTKKITFVKSAGAEFTIGNESKMKRLIGQSSSKTSSGLSLECDGIPDLSGMRLVVINSYNLGKFKISQGDTKLESRKTSCLGSQPMTAGFGGVLKLEQDEDTLDSIYFAGYKNISDFDISLTDENSELLELNNTEWIIELECHVRGSA